VSIYVQYFDMEQLSPQQIWSSLSGDQADSDGTQYNARVTKHISYSILEKRQLYLLSCVASSMHSGQSIW